jgi:hypothetical protein
MKPVTFQIRMECRDDIPDRVFEWMASSLAGHIENQFDYDERPLARRVRVWRIHGAARPTSRWRAADSDHLMQLLLEAVN